MSKITVERAVLGQVLEALESVKNTAIGGKDAITALRAALEQQAEPVAHPTHIYDFAGWLTTRPGTLVAGSKHEAGPMAEAVGEYLRTFPDRFAAKAVEVGR